MKPTCSSASGSAASVISTVKAKLGRELGQNFARRPDSAFGFILEPLVDGPDEIDALLFFRQETVDRLLYQFLRRSVSTSTDSLCDSLLGIGIDVDRHVSMVSKSLRLRTH